MRQIALGILGTAFIATSAFAQTPTAPRLRLDHAFDGMSISSPALKPSLTRTAAVQAAGDEPSVSVAIGADMPSVYYFRGYRQEFDPAFTFQPFVDVGVSQGSTAFNVGLWNSFHTGDLKDAGYGYYETDFYAALTLGVVKATYTAYTYPKIDDSSIHELMFSTSYDDSESSFPMAPSVAVAFELGKASGADKGIYLELGVTPGIPMGDDAPVSISIPVKVGLSLKDYYGGDKVGYVSGGLSLSIPVAEHFEIHGSAIGYVFPGDAMKAYNDKDGDFVGSIGFGLSF